MSTVSITQQNPAAMVASCPECKTRFKIKMSMSGQKARCGKCQTRMVIPVFGANSKTAVTPRKPKQVSTHPGMRKAGTGLLMCAWGSVSLLVLIAGIILFSLMAPIKLAGLQYYWIGGLVASALTTLVGTFVCGFVPKESGASRWIRTTIIVTGVNMAMSGYTFFCAFIGIALIVPVGVIQLAGLVNGLILFFSFMMFMKKVSEFSGRSELAATAKFIMRFQMAIMVVVAGIVTLAILQAPVLIAQVLFWSVLAASLINQLIILILEFQLGSHLRSR